MTNLIYQIIGFASVSWIWTYSTPTNLLKTWLFTYITNKYIVELMQCLMCSTLWITLIGLILTGSTLLTAFLGACIASLLITFIDGHIKFKL